MTALTPSLASPKKSLTSCSLAGTDRRMKMVHGCLDGLLLVGVRAPVLSVAGDITPSSLVSTVDPGRTISAVASLDLGGKFPGSVPFFSSAGAGEAAPLVPPAPSFDAASRSTRSCCLRSFLRSRFARSRSALSAAPVLVVPFARGSLGVSRPEGALT